MADSIPSLRRKLDEANAEIARLRGAAVAPAVVYVDRPVDRIVEVDRPVVKRETVEREVVRTEYIDNPELIQTIRVLQERLAKCQS